MLVGLSVPDIANPFFGELASHIEQAAWQEGYRVVIGSTRDEPTRQDRQLTELRCGNLDGLIFAPAGPVEADDLARAVAIDRPAGAGRTIPFVGLDNDRAGQMLGEHLQQRDYRHIGVVTPDLAGDPTLTMRLAGVRAALGSAAGVDWLIETASAAPLADATETIIERLDGERPEAIIGLTNWSTLAALQAISKLGWTWGQDVGLAGIDDFAAADLLRPGITVVAQPVEQIAREAFSALLSLMTDETNTHPTAAVLLDAIWRDRGSLPHRNP